jgi:STE24 endopeptidase
VLEVEPAEDAEVVVPDQAEVGVLAYEPAALVGPRPVPYEVPEAPDLVRRLGRDGFEHRFERMQVSVDVRDDARAHGRRATVAKVAAGVAVAAIWAAAAALLARTRVPPLDLPDLDPGRYFAAGELERGREFRALTRRLWVGSVAVEVGVLAVLVWKARPLAGKLARFTRGRVRTGVAVGLVAVLAIWFATLPLGAVRHRWNRRYDLSRQGYEDWLGDRAIGLGVRAVLVSIAVAGAVFLAARLGRRWWLAGAPALVAIGVVYVLAQPLVIQPLFNRFDPLPDRALAAEVERLGERIGVRVETVQVADASRRTTTANAYVAGIGPTRRVVFYDTILDGRFGERELVSVAAHELAHVARRHLWKGTAWFALLAVPGLIVVAWATERRGGLRDPALVPLGLLVAVALSLVTLPLQNALSRRYEAEADWIALQATGDPDAAIALDHRLVVTSLGDPDPPGWAEILLSTHPPAIDRIAMAEAFRERGGR